MKAIHVWAFFFAIYKFKNIQFTFLEDKFTQHEISEIQEIFILHSNYIVGMFVCVLPLTINERQFSIPHLIYNGKSTAMEHAVSTLYSHYVCQ